MATLVAVEGWGEGTDVDALSNPSFVPSGFARQDLDVVFAEVMLSVGCVLHNGRLVDAWGRLGGGEMLGVARCCSACRFDDVRVRAGNVVGAGTSVMVDDAVDVKRFDFVLGLDKEFPKGTTRSY